MKGSALIVGMAHERFSPHCRQCHCRDIVVTCCPDEARQSRVTCTAHAPCPDIPKHTIQRQACSCACNFCSPPPPLRQQPCQAAVTCLVLLVCPPSTSRPQGPQWQSMSSQPHRHTTCQRSASPGQQQPQSTNGSSSNLRNMCWICRRQRSSSMMKA